MIEIFACIFVDKINNQLQSCDYRLLSTNLDDWQLSTKLMSSTIDFSTTFLMIDFDWHVVSWVIIIISITKFLIVFGSPHIYLPRNWCLVMWVSNHRFQIWTFCSWIPVIGYPRDSHVYVYCARFNGFHAMFRSAFRPFKTQKKRCRRFRSTGVLIKHCSFRNCYRYD